MHSKALRSAVLVLAAVLLVLVTAGGMSRARRYAILLPPPAASGLPITESWESGTGSWLSLSGPFGTSTVRATDGTTSLRTNPPVNGTTSSGQADRAWGDANLVCTSCTSCSGAACPGGHTPDLWFAFDIYVAQTGSTWAQDDWRKIAQLCVFDDWSATHGSNLNHCVTYISLLVSNSNGDGLVNDIAMNSFRRHDNAGVPITDIANPAGTEHSGAWSNNAWHTVTVHAQLNTPGASDGTFEMWVDTTKTHSSVGNVNWFGGYSGGQTWNMVLLTDNGAGPTSPDTVAMYWDSIKIQKTPISVGASQFATSTWPDVSARCAALGAECICEETLDWNGGHIVNATVNPTNSVTKPCRAGANPVDTNGATTVLHDTISNGDNLPDPQSRITRVLVNDSGGSLDVRISSINWTGGTLCARSYFMFQSGYPVPITALPQSNRFKMHRLHNAPPNVNHAGTQSGNGPGCAGSDPTTCQLQYDFGAYGGPAFGEVTTASWAPSQPYLSDVTGKWIRQEYCTDHYGAGHPTLANRLRSRVRLTRISDGMTWEKNGLHPNAHSIIEVDNTGNGAPYVAHLDTPNWTASPTDMYASDALLAKRTPYDDQFWIGPACEIEGGLNGVPNCP